jgi:hypothetical protein
MHELAQRIPEDSEFRVMADSAFRTVDTFRSKVQELKSDKRFTAAGHAERIREAAQPPLTYLGELRKQLKAEREDLAQRRAHFELPAPDKDDVWSELRAQEARAFLRSLPIGERIALAATDPTMATAALHAPAALSGLNEDGMARAKAFLEQHLFGPELATLAAEDEILANADSALEVAEAALRREVGGPAQKAA